MGLLHNLYGAPHTRVSCQILPYQPVMARFRMNHEVRYRLGNVLNKERFNLEREQDLVVQLDAAWQETRLRGAILISAWDDNVARLFDDDNPQSQRLTLLQPVNPLLVLNVLGRSRAGILLPHFPLSLEPQFINRDLVTCDQRLVQESREA